MGGCEAEIPSLSFVRGQGLELACWFIGFQLGSTQYTTCHDTSAASFGNERQQLGPTREKAFEMYTATSLLCVFS